LAGVGQTGYSPVILKTPAGLYKLIIFFASANEADRGLYQFDLDPTTLAFTNKTKLLSVDAGQTSDNINPFYAWVGSSNQESILIQFYDASEVPANRYKLRLYRYEGGVWTLKQTTQVTGHGNMRPCHVNAGRLVAYSSPVIVVSDGGTMNVVVFSGSVYWPIVENGGDVWVPNYVNPNYWFKKSADAGANYSNIVVTQLGYLSYERAP
jgi:hypothetical protein